MKNAPRRVLNAGSGPAQAGKVHAGFAAGKGWSEVRLDIDPRAGADLTGSISDMRGIVADASFDALWSSHSIEHLHAHEVAPAFGEFRRVLKADGFALVTCPDIEAIAKLLIRDGLEAVAYKSPAGPIRPLDMLYGHGPSIAQGYTSMSHNTGFTAERIGRLALAAGFAEIRIMEGPSFDLWAALLTPKAALADIAPLFAGTNVAALFEEAPADGAREPLRVSAAGGRAR
jgi:SAM-dependent methyltransferase